MQRFTALACIVGGVCAALPPITRAQSPAPVPALSPTSPASTASAPRQRLALVVGVATVGGRSVLPSARRDAEAVAMALRQGGFQVLLKLDPSAQDLRGAFKQFKDTLQPDALGIAYLVGPMAQVDGRNLLVPSDIALAEGAEAPAVAALLRVVGVPAQEVVTALAGPPDAPRVLVLDGAWRVAPLSRLVPPGLTRPRLADGMLGVLGHAPAALQDPPAADTPGASLGATANEPKARAASALAKAMADALALTGVTVAEAMRAVRLVVLDGSGGRIQPAISGGLATRVELVQKAAAQPAAEAPAAPPAPAAPAAPASAASAPTAGRPSSDNRTERAPGQGERPVYQTRTNSFGHAEGDVLSYERSDRRKDELLASYVIAIDKVESDGRLQANGGAWLMDAEGRLVSMKAEDGSESRFEPAESWWWARPRAGETRAVQFSESYQRSDKSRGRLDWRGQAQVGSVRTLEVPAGEHEVLPIRVTGQGTDTPEGGAPRQLLFTRVVYFAPKLGVPVAIDIEDNDASGRPLKRERIELTHAQQSRTVN